MNAFPTHPPVALSKDFKLSWNDGSCVTPFPRLTTSVDLRYPPYPLCPVETINKVGVSKMKSKKTIHESIIKSYFPKMLIYKKIWDRLNNSGNHFFYISIVFRLLFSSFSNRLGETKFTDLSFSVTNLHFSITNLHFSGRLQILREILSSIFNKKDNCPTRDLNLG